MLSATASIVAHAIAIRPTRCAEASPKAISERTRKMTDSTRVWTSSYAKTSCGER